MVEHPAFDAALVDLFGADRVGRDVPLAPFTTFKVGGPADWLVEPRTADETIAALRLAHDARVRVTIIGGGSNVLVGDHGVRGLVLRPRGGIIQAVGGGAVRADAAVTLNGLVRWTIGHRCAGLEAWAGTPGTVGGAVCGNAHYGGRLIGDLVSTVTVAGADGTLCELPHGAMEFGYDRSRLQRTREVLLWAVFRLSPDADAAALRAVARQSLAHRKRTQPLDRASAGCVFQNPMADDPVPDGIPRSAGALVDRAGLTGHRMGGACVSTIHANFIVNEGGATAADIRALAALCQKTVLGRFGVLLREEIVYLGEF
jgi:UDP-N-acetylmuramate dehydrogenase